MYTCARCGEDSIETLEQDDDHQTSHEHEDLREGWCNVCEDYRRIED